MGYRLAHLPVLLLLAALVAVPPGASTAHAAEQRVHVVAKGQTLGAIARRYHVTIKELCEANGIRRKDIIRPGQKLVIPDDDESHRSGKRRTSTKSRKASSDSMQTLSVPGTAPAYYYEPTGRGRLGLRPVLMILHGRGGNPKTYCRRFATVGRPLGWVVCPTGPATYGNGHRWRSWTAGRHIIMATLKALREKYGRRVQLYGNTLVGFSEGAYVAMNVGVREPRAFNRWLILGASSSYWGTTGVQALKRNARRLRRVFLLTGKKDGVYESTREVRSLLRKVGVPTRVSYPSDMGHWVALDSKTAIYRTALAWLQR